MSLFGRAGLDASSWARSLRSSYLIILGCAVGFLSSWLILRVLFPSVDNTLTLDLYNSAPNGSALLAIFWIGTLGDVIWIPLVFWLYVFRKDKHEWTSAVILAVAMMFALGMTDLLKALFNLPRPFSLISGIVPRYGAPSDPGFPSGHATHAFTVATVIWTRYPVWRLPFVVLAILTGLSRILLGVHFLSDVLGGVFLGVFCGTFALDLAKLRSSQ